MTQQEQELTPSQQEASRYLYAALYRTRKLLRYYDYEDPALAERIVRKLPGLTVADLKAVDDLCRTCHGCQTEVEVCYDGGRLHYQATGPVLPSPTETSWEVRDEQARIVQTSGLQWSGYSLARTGGTADQLVRRLAGY